MVNTVYTIETVTLQDEEETEIELRPNPIARQRKFMARLTEGPTEEDTNAWEMMLDLVTIALERRYPNIVKDREELEEILDEQTAFKILEVTGGVKLNDPKLMEAALQAMEAEQAGTS